MCDLRVSSLSPSIHTMIFTHHKHIVLRADVCGTLAENYHALPDAASSEVRSAKDARPRGSLGVV